MLVSDLIFNFVSITEKAAIESSKFIGSDDKMGADQVATDSMRSELNKINISGEIVIGEGERDEAPMLFIGEKVGQGGTEVDIAVDPLEGTNLCAANLPGSICVMALGPKGSLFSAPDTYMDKIVVGKEVSDEISLNNSLEQNIKLISKGYKISQDKLNFIVLDRERHIDLIADLRELGVNVQLISDGDVMAGVSAVLPNTPVHALMGIGAAPEGVIKSVAVKSLGGKMRAKFKPQNDEVRTRMLNKEIDIDKEYTENDLAKGEDLLFVATGVTSGDILKGVSISNESIHTESIFISLKNSQITKLQSVHLK